MPTRLLTALLAAAVLPACFAATAPAASKALTLPVPAAGDVTVANVTFTVSKRGGSVPAPRVAGANALGEGLTVVGGLRRAGRRRLQATAVVVRANGDANVSGVTLQVRLPRGARFGTFVRRQIVESVLRRGGRPSYCGSLPKTFAHVAARPLAGGVAGFDARTIAKYATSLGCRSFPERSRFLSAIGNETGGGGGSGGGGSELPEGCGEEGRPMCPDEAALHPTTSETLTATGSVTRDPADPRRFSYSLTFNEPIYSFVLAARPATIHCPASVYAAWSSTCPPESVQPGHGLKCEDAAYVWEFRCGMPRNADGDPTGTPLPAGQTVDGVFLTSPDQAPPTFTSVEVTAHQTNSGAGANSRPTTIPVS